LGGRRSHALGGERSQDDLGCQSLSGERGQACSAVSPWLGGAAPGAIRDSPSRAASGAAAPCGATPGGVMPCETAACFATLSDAVPGGEASDETVQERHRGRSAVRRGGGQSCRGAVSSGGAPSEWCRPPLLRRALVLGFGDREANVSSGLVRKLSVL
jgi:hypothetical protein